MNSAFRPFWPHFAVLSLICAAYAVAYAATGMPDWIVIFTGLSACLIGAAALDLRAAKVAAEAQYDFGRCNGRLARRNKATGEVDFLHYIGQQCGHRHHEWCRFHPDWWPHFVSGAAAFDAPAKTVSLPSSTVS